MPIFSKRARILGHLISKDGVKPTESRIKNVQEAPPPKNKQELQSFLGMATYNAKFLPSLSHVLHPLHQLLKKNAKWSWNLEHMEAFNTVKCMICEDNVGAL